MIDENKLIERFKQLKGSDSLANMFIKDVIKEIENQPQIDNWIPCSERLPEVSERIDREYCPEFNVTIKGAKKATTLQCDSEGTWFDGYGNVYQVIAWQPLPDAYKECD